jgi:hypothetical protein
MGIVREFLLFLRERKAYWITPIVLALLILALLIVLAPSGALTFIYPIF